MSFPLLSICIPTYKRVDCLRQCLASIIDQFNDPSVRERVEVVISDNASNDGTEQLIKEYQKEFSNIYYYKNSENIGHDGNVLNVAEKAKGYYVWFLGDDDALFPDALGYLLEKLKSARFKYCLVNCLGYDNKLLNPAVRHPNFPIESDQYFGHLWEYVSKMKKNRDLVGCFCGLSMQVFDRNLWQAWPNKKEYVGTNVIHMHILLSVMKEQSFAIIAKPLVKVRAANIRWDTFPGLETSRKRAQSTTKGLIWILDTYDIHYSELFIKIQENVNIFISWATNILKKYILRNQGSRDLIKKIFGKL